MPNIYGRVVVPPYIHLFVLSFVRVRMCSQLSQIRYRFTSNMQGLELHDQQVLKHTVAPCLSLVVSSSVHVINCQYEPYIHAGIIGRYL